MSDGRSGRWSRWPRGCGGKGKYLTWDDAEAAGLWHGNEGHGAVLAYRCSECDFWHVGHWNLKRTPLETAKLKGLI